MVGMSVIAVIALVLTLIALVLFIFALAIALLARAFAKQGRQRVMYIASILATVVGSAIVSWAIYYAVHTYDDGGVGGTEAINIGVNESAVGILLFVVGLGLAGLAIYAEARVRDLRRSLENRR